MDIREPVGLLFVIIGALLIGYGLLAHVAPFAGLNLDLIWGCVMAVSGALLWLLARRAA